MEPQLPPVGMPVERGDGANNEQAPAVAAPNLPEAAPIHSPERARSVETSAGDARGLAMPTAQPQSVALPQPAVQTPAADGSTALTTTTPATAADDDVIEKEWVTKAKQVVQTTKDDPHAQASQVSQLMVDYVQKRYGKEVGKTS